MAKIAAALPLERFFSLANPPPSQARFWPKTNIRVGSGITGPIAERAVDKAEKKNALRISIFSVARGPASAELYLGMVRIRRGYNIGTERAQNHVPSVVYKDLCGG